ncbi:MAG: DUF1223 domain-containing protein, partial [Gammaproteobacteria bacterium]|nr:DUF1223 domain-containing protein [Gammaproteobacteria bacterium]
MKRIPHSRYQPCIPTLRRPGVSTMYKGPGVPFMLWLTALLILPGAGSGTQVSQDRPGSAQPQSIHVNSGPRQVALLELFTSEGCSSCPPADRWLSGLIDDPRLWRELVPVAFHVDYWDYLGWPDRFASREFSRRQRDHARSGGLSQVYTPGVVLNGAEWRGWHRGRPLPT